MVLGYVHWLPLRPLPSPDSSAQVLSSKAQPLVLFALWPCRAAHAVVLCCPLPSAFLTLAAYKAWTSLNR